MAKRTKARGKQEAKRLAMEIELRVERQQLGLEPRNDDSAGTVIELLEWWLETYSVARATHQGNVYTVKRHFAGSALGAMPIARLNAAAVERFLVAKTREHLAPQTINHLRCYLLTAFNCAKRVGKYAGPNPILDVQRRKVPKRKPDYLRQHEAPAVLVALKEQHRALFATAIYTGLRRGELCALRKTDIDFSTGLLTVSRSHHRDITKGGRVDAIPIAEELVPYLQEAMHRSPCELVFPNQDGKQWRRDADFPDVLRTALKRAGIVQGYEHVCRKRGCGHKELHADAE